MGMPKSASMPCPDSIMLSCFSPAKPCCGPKRARSPSPQRRRTTSRAGASALVTEAGCMSSPTRRPRSHRGRARASTSRPVTTRAPGLILVRAVATTAGEPSTRPARSHPRPRDRGLSPRAVPVDETEEALEVDRFRDERGAAKRRRERRVLAQSRADDGRYGREVTMPQLLGPELPSVHDGHHQVEQDDAGPQARLEGRERRHSVLGGHRGGGPPPPGYRPPPPGRGNRLLPHDGRPLPD